MKNVGVFRRREILSGAIILHAVAGVPLAGSAADKIKIGLIGAGRIGGTLGKFWSQAGYPVMLSAQNIGPVKDLVAQIGQLLPNTS